ncbi:hypothetical protein QAD02_007763 [Eretmocerus hayati]|uniref:Uncharacterized protein n=1 Tax=Eretmocerus hayati TaxID=131215 RepID=A0ACC2N5Z1_9HYME|nr:hypothetical protein QAD02_007763 [Eretmocerus hayati]
MNVHSGGRPRCAVCEKPVKRDATSKLCTGCARLVHVECVPLITQAELCYECPNCKLTDLEFPRVSTTLDPANSGQSNIFVFPSEKSPKIVNLRGLNTFSIPSTPTPFASAICETSSACVSATPKRLASPSSPSISRDAKQHCPSFTLSEASDLSSVSLDSQINLGSSQENNGIASNTPAYLTEFLQIFNTLMDSVSTQIIDLDNNVSARITQIENRVDSVESSVEYLTNRTMLVDNAEILISGLPRNVQLSHAEIVPKLFNELGVSHLTIFIINMRTGNGPDLTPLENVPNIQAQGGPPNNQPRNPNFFALVMKMNSTIVRDEIISRTPILKDQSVSTILNIPGNSKIFCRALWPREIYQLYEKALVTAKQLNYERPLVKNLTVCMRQTRTSRLIPVNSEFEPGALISRPPPVS